MSIRWTQEMKVGAEPIDQQHERLVRMLNDLETQIAGHNQLNIRRLVLDLVSYTRYHFYTEELLMRARGWPGFAAHRAEHTQYRARLLDLERRLVERSDFSAAKEIEAILVDFIKDHMQGTDRETWIEMKRRGML